MAQYPRVRAPLLRAVTLAHNNSRGPLQAAHRELLAKYPKSKRDLTSEQKAARRIAESNEDAAQQGSQRDERKKGRTGREALNSDRGIKAINRHTI
jgi:hypothetical protein